MTFTYPYFSPEVMVKFTRKVKGHFMTLIKIVTRQTECNPEERGMGTKLVS